MPQKYIEDVYQKALLGDVVECGKVRSPQAMCVLVKKASVTLYNEASFSSIFGMFKAIRYGLSRWLSSNIWECPKKHT